MTIGRLFIPINITIANPIATRIADTLFIPTARLGTAVGLADSRFPGFVRFLPSSRDSTRPGHSAPRLRRGIPRFATLWFNGVLREPKKDSPWLTGLSSFVTTNIIPVLDVAVEFTHIAALVYTE